MQPPAGPPVWTALNGRPSTMPPPMPYTMSRSEVPIGTSTRPVLTTRPASANTFVPLLFSVPMPANQARAVADDRRDVGERLDVVDQGRAGRAGPTRPGTAGAGRGVPRPPSIDAISAVSSPHTNAPAPSRTSTSNENWVSMHGRAEVAVLRGLADRLAQPGNGERVLRAAVDVAGARADRVGRDRHALEHPVRVALQHGAVHERAGVALVGVADHDLGRARRLGDRVPLEPGRVPGAAPAAEAAGGDLVAHLGGRPRREHLAQGLVAAVRDGIVEALGVHEAGSVRRRSRTWRAKNGAGLVALRRRAGCVRSAAITGSTASGVTWREDVAGLGDLDERAARAQARGSRPA